MQASLNLAILRACARSTPSNSQPPLLVSQTDQELIDRLRAGQTAALGKLYDRYSGLVYTLALKILTHPQDAEDVTQEVFLSLWRRGRYDPTRGSLSSFLATMTRSRSIDRLRSRDTTFKALNHLHHTLSARPSSPTPFEQVSSQERREYIRHALAQLPEKHRQVLELSYFEGRSQSDIAKHMKAPLGTVKTWARKGLLQLRKNLQDRMED